jgi:adhesin/invasin
VKSLVSDPHYFETTSGSPLPFSSNGVSVTVNNLAAPILSLSPEQLVIQIPYEAGAGAAVLSVNNNGQIAGLPFQFSSSAPGILPPPQLTLPAQRGGPWTVFVTGAGDVSPRLSTGFAPKASKPVPVLPVSVTVGGVPAFLQAVGITSGQIGTVQIDFTVPPSVAPGDQPVVVTIGGVLSPPANLKVY